MRPQCQAWLPDRTRCKNDGKRTDPKEPFVCEQHQGKPGLEFAKLGEWAR
jgi:hypothetical protein